MHGAQGERLSSCRGAATQVKEFLKDPGAFIVEAAPEASGGGGGGGAAEEKKEEAKPEEEEEEEDDVSAFPTIYFPQLRLLPTHPDGAICPVTVANL